MARFARLTGTRAHCELDRQWSTTPPSRAHALPGSPQRHPDTGSKTRRRLLRARLALPTPVGPVRRRSGSRNRRRSPRAGRRALRGQLDSCSLGFSGRKFSRASDGLVLGPAVPQALPTRPPRRVAVTWTSCSFEFAVPRVASFVRVKTSLALTKESALHCSRTANDRTDCVTLRNAYDDIQQTCLSATPLF